MDFTGGLLEYRWGITDDLLVDCWHLMPVTSFHFLHIVSNTTGKPDIITAFIKLQVPDIGFLQMQRDAKSWYFILKV